MIFKVRNIFVISAFCCIPFFKTINASDLDLSYNPASETHQFNNSSTHNVNSKSHTKTSDMFKNMGADGRNNMLKADAKSRQKLEQKGKGKGDGKGKGKGRGKHSS